MQHMISICPAHMVSWLVLPTIASLLMTSHQTTLHPSGPRPGGLQHSRCLHYCKLQKSARKSAIRRRQTITEVPHGLSPSACTLHTRTHNCTAACTAGGHLATTTTTAAAAAAATWSPSPRSPWPTCMPCPQGHLGHYTLRSHSSGSEVLRQAIGNSSTPCRSARNARKAVRLSIPPGPGRRWSADVGTRTAYASSPAPPAGSAHGRPVCMVECRGIRLDPFPKNTFFPI